MNSITGRGRSFVGSLLSQTVRVKNGTPKLGSKYQLSKRQASQLYPIASQRWENAMLEAESLVGDSSDFSNLNKWVSGEFNNITKYLQKLVGTNHPMLETAKRCTYISEGRMGSAQARGLTVILTAKAIENLPSESYIDGRGPKRQRKELIKDQVSLAEMAEITYSAYMIHRGVVDLKLHGLDQHLSDPIAHTKGLHYGNKVSVLCGDFLLAYVMRGLGDLFSSQAVNLIASAISEFMEGEFLLLDDWRSINYLNGEQSRDLNRWIARTQATIGSLQGNTCQATLVLADVKKSLQLNAREFGRNLGLAWQAHTELQPFLKSEYEPIELAELPAYPAFDLNCLPIMLFLKESHRTNKNFQLLLKEIKSAEPQKHVSQHIHQELVDYKRLHQLTLEQGYPIEESFNMIRNYSQIAISHLKFFPKSQARDVLQNICVSLYED